MTERPILFSAPMVRAILEGRKTQTRRIIKSWWEDKDDDNWPMFADEYGQWHRERCSYGQVGDHLWVREAFLHGVEYDDNEKPRYDEQDLPIYKTWYRATDAYSLCWYGDDGYPTENIPWKPSIHMPRRASRIDLEITGVRIEMLQDTSDKDALAEGVDQTNTSIKGYATERFKNLWESIYGAGSWNANPWVWVIEFKRVKP